MGRIYLSEESASCNILAFNNSGTLPSENEHCSTAILTFDILILETD